MRVDPIWSRAPPPPPSPRPEGTARVVWSSQRPGACPQWARRSWTARGWRCSTPTTRSSPPPSARGGGAPPLLLPPGSHFFCNRGSLCFRAFLKVGHLLNCPLPKKRTQGDGWIWGRQFGQGSDSHPSSLSIRTEIGTKEYWLRWFRHSSICSFPPFCPIVVLFGFDWLTILSVSPVVFPAIFVLSLFKMRFATPARFPAPRKRTRGYPPRDARQAPPSPPAPLPISIYLYLNLSGANSMGGRG